MHIFIDREPEMKTLKKEYSTKDSSLVIVYGRRRVGKTTLLTEFIREKQALYFLATQESEVLNLAAFKDKVAEFTGNDLLSETTIDKWDTAFKAIVSHSFKQKPIIVIDEFQYLGKTNPAFPSIFQRIWDQVLKEANIMVVLCGSL
ncbi:MAG: AAA family ATPase, partial [Clostridia bacterium]|nr:AAA family ATPase [Clostridia bacterium]